MSKEAINNAINQTALKGLVSADDIVRWQGMDKLDKSSTLPMWISIMVGLGSSADLELRDIEGIVRAVEDDSNQFVKDDLQLYLSTAQDSLEEVIRVFDTADSATRQGDLGASASLWLKAFQKAIESRVVPIEPYRMFANLASSAFGNGDLALGSVALDMALEINPNYSFGLELKEREVSGEFFDYSLAKMKNEADTNHPMDSFITEADLRIKSNKQIYTELKKQGIELNDEAYLNIAESVTDSIEGVVGVIVSQAKSDQEVDSWYVHVASLVLWERLVARPLFETIQDIIFELEDCLPESIRHGELIKKLAWAVENCHQSVFDKYAQYHYEQFELRHVVHGLLTTEVLTHSSSAKDVLVIAERLLASGYFPDMLVHDVVRRIRDSKNWHRQLELLVKNNPEYRQVIVMGVVRGLVLVGMYQEAIDTGRQLVWDLVLGGDIDPMETQITQIGDYLDIAYEEIGNRKAILQFHKEEKRVMTIIEDFDNRQAMATLKEKGAKGSLMSKLLQQDAQYSSLFDYFDFINSLGLNFATVELTNDRISATIVNHGPRVGRNEPCPCGSGKKYKKCHG